jgi:transposase-like protein
MVYLWRAIDAEGEVLDILAPSERNKNAALKLMRKLLKKYGFVPDRTITDDLQSRGAAAYDFKIESRHSVVDERIIELRIHISRPGEGSVRCSASRARAQRSNSFQRTPRPTTY